LGFNTKGASAARIGICNVPLIVLSIKFLLWRLCAKMDKDQYVTH